MILEHYSQWNDEKKKKTFSWIQVSYWAATFPKQSNLDNNELSYSEKGKKNFVK